MKKNLKDFNKRLIVFKEEKKMLLYKFIIRSTNLSKNLRKKAHENFYKYTNFNFSKVRTKNRCIFTSRAKSISKKMKVSRIIFRKLVSEGNLNGIKKSSW